MKRIHFLLALFALLSGIAYAQAPKLYWRFENPAPWLDATPVANHLNISPPVAGGGVPSLVGDGFNVTYAIPPSTGCDTVDALALHNSLYFSYEMLFQTTHGFEEGMIANWYGKFFVILTPDNLNIYLATTTGSPVNEVFNFSGIGSRDPHNLFDGEWHHLAITYNATAGELRVYVDGIAPPEYRKVIGVGSAIASGGTEIYLTSTVKSYHVMDLNMDEIAYYDTLLTEAMVYQHWLDVNSGSPYSASTTLVDGMVPSLPSSEELNPLDFAANYPDTTLMDSVMVTLKKYPGPRLRYNTPVPRLGPFVIGLSHTGIKNTTPALKIMQGQTGSRISEELARNYHYSFLLGNTWEGDSAASFLDPTQYPYHSVRRAALVNNLPRYLINFWSFMDTDSAGIRIPRPMVYSNWLTPADSFYIPGSGEWTTLGLFGAFTGRRDSIEKDGLEIRRLIQNYHDALVLYATDGHIETVAENDELYLLSDSLPAMGFGPIFSDFTAVTGFLGIPTWKAYLSYRRNELRKFVRDTWKPYLDGIALPGSGNAVWYNIAGESLPAFYMYSLDHTMNLDPLGNHRPTTYFYPRNVFRWRKTFGPPSGWDRQLFAKPEEFAAGDSISQPFVSPGFYDAASYTVSDDYSLRPGQYLGLLKGLGFLGAETFHHFDYDAVGGLNPHLGEWRTHKAAMPSYAQGVISRLDENFLYGGYVLKGDFTGLLYDKFSFDAGHENDLVMVRRQYGADRFVILGAIERLANDKSAGEKEKEVSFRLHDASMLFTRNLQIRIREQGSTYVYDPTVTGGEVFYQLDRWHEWKEPSHWCGDFLFEAEVPDSGLAGATIRTERPAGAVVGDFRQFTSYVTYNGAVSGAPLKYAFLERDPGLSGGVYGWVRARHKAPPLGMATPTGYLRLTIGGTSHIIEVPDTALGWKWYRLDSGGMAMFFATVDDSTYEGRLRFLDRYSEVDQVLFTHSADDPSLASTPSTFDIYNQTRDEVTTTFACRGDTLDFLYTSELDGYCTEYLWDFGDGVVSYEVNPQHAYIDNGEYTVTLIWVTNPWGYTDTLVRTLTIGAPNVDAGANFMFCPPDSFLLSGWADSTAISWWWTPDTLVAKPDSLSTMAWADTSQWFLFHAVDDSGCVGIDSVKAEESITNIWTDLLTGDDTLDLTLCGDTMVLVKAYGSAWGVRWEPPGMVLDDSASTTWTVSLPADTTFNLLVIGWDRDFCSYDTAMIHIVVHPEPVGGIATPDTTLCDSTATICLDGFGPVGASYLWSPVLPPVVVVPPTTPTSEDFCASFNANTIMQLVVTDPVTGCEVEDEVLVKLNDIEVGIVRPVLDSVFCLLDSLPLTAFGGGTYSWTPAITTPTPTAETAMFSVWDTIAYEVTVIDSFGCRGSDSYVFTPDTNCCFVGGMEYVGINRTVSQMQTTLGYGTPTFSGLDIRIEGTLTVNVGATFTNCTFHMGPYSLINLSSGIAATFTNCTFQAVCDTMWNGMKVTGATSHLQLTSCTVKDAIYAVHSVTAGRYTLSQSSFQLCFAGVKVEAFSGTHAGVIRRCSFLGGSALSLVPYIGTRPRYGVWAGSSSTLSGQLNVGDDTNPAWVNTFDRLVYGIYARRTHLMVTNNNFSNINLALPGLFRPGTAILDSMGGGSARNLIVGTGSAMGRFNTFSYCGRGIHAEGRIKTVVEHNQFTGGSVGIAVLGQNADSVRIRYNRITDVPTGIMCGPWSNVFGIISLNDINSGVSGARGIVFSNSTQTAALGTLRVKAWYNTVKLRGRGISVLSSTYVSLQGNTITTTTTGGAATTAGIYIEGGQRNVAHCNTISGSWASDTLKRGIHLNGSPRTTLTRNVVSNHGFLMLFEENNTSSTVVRNKMSSGKYGFVLKGSAATIGPQISNTTKSENEWATSVTVSRAHSMGTAIGTTSKLWVNLSGVYNPSPATFEPGAFAFAIGSASGAPPTYTCPPPPPDPPIDSLAAAHAKQEVLTLIASGLDTFVDYEAESQWKSRYHFYDALTEDTLLRDSVTLFSNYYWDTITPTVLAEVFRVNEYKAKGLVDSAKILNDAIVPSVVTETNYKTVNGIYLDSYSRDSFSLDSATIASLIDIALQCPVEAGYAVFEARAMLAIHEIFIWGDTLCESPSERQMADGTEQDIQPSVRVFPNPTGGQLTFALDHPMDHPCLIIVRNMLGLEVARYSIPEGETTIETRVNQWPNGIYLWTADTGNGKWAGKVVVAK